MKPATIVGFALGGFSFTHEKKDVDAGPIQIGHEQKKTVPIPPALSAIALIGGGMGVSLRKTRTEFLCVGCSHGDDPTCRLLSHRLFARKDRRWNERRQDLLRQPRRRPETSVYGVWPLRKFSCTLRKCV